MDLNASLTIVFPLPRVVPHVSSVLAADLRTGRALNTQEVRLQLEGLLLDFLYVNGTEQSFIQESDEEWKINVRSFQEIAEGMFGDFASARVCRLGSVLSYSTLDEAVRACIEAVINPRMSRI